MKCSNMVANILPTTLPLIIKVNRSKFNFSEQFYVAYQIKGNHEYTATLSQIFCLQTSPPLISGLGSKGQSSASSEHGHVVYQIKGNHECIDNVATF